MIISDHIPRENALEAKMEIVDTMAIKESASPNSFRGFRGFRGLRGLRGVEGVEGAEGLRWLRGLRGVKL